MPNNTYEGDAGVKYNFVKDHEPTEDNTDDMFAGSITDDEDYQSFDSDFLDDDSDEPDPDRADDSKASEEGFSVLSDSERKYKWEKPAFKDDDSAKAAADPKPRKARRASRRDIQTDDDENYDLEIGNNSVGLKILMSLMLITFIVIISVLIYKLSVLNDQYLETLAKLDAAPTLQQLNEANTAASDKDQQIQQLTNELSQYKVDNAPAGQLIETPEGSVYVVAANDTLGKIAQEYQVDINQIMEWNNLDNADNIKVGQRLIVKKADDTAGASEPAN